MSILSYDEIYSFPGGYRKDFHHEHYPRHFKPSYAYETSKCIDIYDKFGQLRYVVQLSSENFANGRGYKIIVSQNLEEGLVAFLYVPTGDQYEMNYYKALEDFNGCIKKYQSLINAEMRDFRDIDVYKEDIGYEVQHPKCCSSCKWCMKTFENDDFHIPHHRKAIKFQCCSPENEQVFNYSQQFPQLPSQHRFQSWQKLPWQKPTDVNYGHPEWDPNKFPSIMFPTVDPMGICDNYLSGECEYNKHHRHHSCYGPLAKTIAPTYTVNVSCLPGDLVYYCGTLYECISAHNGGIWDKSHFVATTIDDMLKQKASIDDISNIMSSSLSNYVTSSDVSNMLSTTLQDYVMSSDLSNYATKDEVANISNALSNYAMLSTLSDYVTINTVSSIVSTMTSSYSEGIETISTALVTISNGLSNYATYDDLSNYATKDNVNELSNITTQISNALSNYLMSADLSDFATKYDISTMVSAYDYRISAISISLSGLSSDILCGISGGNAFYNS